MNTTILLISAFIGFAIFFTFIFSSENKKEVIQSFVLKLVVFFIVFLALLVLESSFSDYRRTTEKELLRPCVHELDLPANEVSYTCAQIFRNFRISEAIELAQELENE